MRFSTRTRYGLRFLLRLADQPRGNLTQLGQIAHEENISPGYLEQIVRALKPMGILHAVRGAGGGYSLAKRPEDIVMEDVFMHLEGELAPVSCLCNTTCHRADFCVTRDFWQQLDEHVRTFLRGKTLAHIMASRKERLLS